VLPAVLGAAGSRTRRAGLGNPHRRLRTGLALVLLLFTVLAGRLVQIQAFDGEAYAQESEKQRLVSTVLPAMRGAILDRNGAVLAQTVQARAVYADPKLVTRPEVTAARLAPLLGRPRAEILAKITRKKRSDGRAIRFVYLARELDPSVGTAVRSLRLAGIGVSPEERRDVPGDALARNIVGTTNREGTGLAGIEARYDEVLRGKDGSRAYEVGLGGQAIPRGHQAVTAAQPGRSVQLTLDRDLQFQAEAMLTERIRATKGLTGTAVVLDIRTGEVLAMAGYDAAVPPTARTRTDLATAAVVEPGSVHKAITVAAGLEEGVVTPATVLTVDPTIRKGGRTFRDTHVQPRVDMTLQGVLAQSSNVGTIQVADRLGPRRLVEYQRRFGLGARTGVGLPGEAPGIVQDPENWSGSSYGAIPIGLGVAATPLQMASVFATIANDGVRVAPRIVRGTRGADGRLEPAPPAPRQQVVSAANARALRLMLEAVPTSEGTARRAAIPGYRVAGKTGTGKRAQGDRYLPGNVASFVGIAPADAPRFVVGVFVHAPAGVGGGVAGPVFADLMSFTLRHYAVPPTGVAAPPVRVYAGGRR